MCPCFVKKSENCKNAFIYDIICSKIIYYTQIIDNCEIKDENTDNLKMSFAKYFIADLQPLSQLRCQFCQASPYTGEPMGNVQNLSGCPLHRGAYRSLHKIPFSGTDQRLPCARGGGPC